MENEENNKIAENIENEENNKIAENKGATEDKASKINEWLNKIYVHVKEHKGIYITSVLVIIAPWLLTRESCLGDFSQFDDGTSEIADTIGGITAPIIGLFSAILVYLAFREQRSAIKEQVEDNAFAHEKALFVDILKDLKKFMTDPPDKFILDVPTYGSNESSERKAMIDKYKMTYEENRERINDVCVQLQFNFAILKDGKYSSLFINNVQKVSSGVKTNSQLTRQIQLLSLEIESFLYLFGIIQKHLQQRNEEHQISVYILFRETEKVFLFYYAWIWGMLQDNKFDMGKMSDVTDNYEHLKKRIDLAHKEYLDLEKNQIFQLTYIID